ncbi:MAG: hypothetical protein R3A47_04760 [Polyangiales bacterium]
MLANEHGAIQRLTTDAAMGQILPARSKNLRTAASEVTDLGQSLKSISREIEQEGEGSVHRIVYGPDAAEAVKNLRVFVGTPRFDAGRDPLGRWPDHSLIYGKVEEGFFRSLNSASADIAAITASIRKGDGTIGGLIADPSVYEDLKRVIGDLERNDILRALVRYSIKRDEARQPIQTAPKD